jgi:CRISPR-associated protein Csm5
MKTYKLKLTVLSPIHIGTGEDYEPINYVIDKAKAKLPGGKIVEKDYMFVFDEMEFYKNLDNIKQLEFTKIVSETSYDARFKLYGFIASHKEIAKKIAFQKVSVKEEVAKDYYRGIGKVVNKERDGRKVFNSFTIAKTYILPNTQKPILPGSSLKGSISTAYQEELYRQTRNYEKVQELMLKPTHDNIFKNLSIADANPIKHATFVGEAINKKRKIQRSGIPVRVQAIMQTSEFKTQITIKDKLDFRVIAKSCNDHYLPLFKSQFNYETDEYTRLSLADSFVARYENWQPQQNQFLLKVGKYSGARAVTVDGIRKIKIKTNRGFVDKDEETTFWSINALPFGWLLCEIID